MKITNLFLCFFLASQVFLLNAALTADKIKTALDNPEGVEFSAPGTYGGSKDAWSVKKGSEIPDTKKNCSGTVSAVNGTCLVGKAPSANGYLDYYNQRNRNYFTVTVKGAGNLDFNYRAALDNDYDSFLWIYEYSGDNANQLYYDKYNNPKDEDQEKNWVNTELYEFTELASETGDWWYKVDDGAYDLTSDKFWLYSFAEAGTDAYTHTITFAIVAKAKQDYEYDDNGNVKYVDIEDYYEGTEVIENKVYLDNFVWTPNEDIATVKLSPEDGTSFSDSLTASISTDYAEDVFLFYYTLDGTMPTTSSKRYVISDEEEDDGIEITSECTLWVRAYEKSTASFADDGVKATYHQNLPAPIISYEVVEDFSDTTKIIIDSNGAAGAEFHYTLDGSTPSASSPTITSNTVMKNEDLAGKTMQVIAVAPSSKKTSEVSNQLSFERSTTPALTWKIDGTASEDTYFHESVEVTLAENWLSVPDSGKLEASGKIQVASFEEGKISSEVVEQEFIWLDGTMIATKAALAPEEDQKAWILFTMPGVMREDDMKKLCAWLNPVAFDANRKALVQTETLEANAVYFVYMPGLTGDEPGELYYSSVDYTPAGTGWQLVPTGATYTLKNNVWKTVEAQPGEDNEKVPGWKKQ